MPAGGRGHHEYDVDICNQIDLLVRTAVEEGNGTNIWDEGEKATLVDIRQDSNRNDLWAIVKENTNPRSKGKQPLAVVTLLYSSMVEDSRTSGKWKEETVETVTLLETLTPVKGTEVPEKQPSPQGLILIRYLNKGSSAPIYAEWADVESAETCLNKLRRNSAVDTNSIRVFSEVTTEAKIVI